MQYIFYPFLGLAMYYEFKMLLQPSTWQSIKNSLSEIKIGEYKPLLYVFFQFGYALWGFIGLFTSQVFFFTLLWILSLLNLRRNIAGVILDSALSLIILILICLNKIEWHLSTQAIIKLIFNIH